MSHFTPRGVNWTAEEDALIKKHAGIKSTQEIASLVTAVGKRTASVNKIKSRVQLINRTRFDKISLRRIGEYHARSVGSKHDIELCRALREAGETVKSIAEKMGFGMSHVNGIVYFNRRLRS